MDSKPAPRQPAQRSGWQAFFATPSTGSVGITIGLALAVAALLNPIFMLPFPVLLGRTLFVGMMLLLVFAAARLVPQAALPRWLPRWVVPVCAVAAAAPFFTAAVYLASVGGSVGSFIDAPSRVAGFMWIAGSAMVLSLLAAAAALMRERLVAAERRALALELDRSRLEKQAVDAQLSLLQAQIEPPFLFDTLANMQALVESNSPRAADVLKSLIAYLRAAMPRLHDQAPTLGNEIALVQAYLQLMQMRMPDRLRFALQVDPAMLGLRLPHRGRTRDRPARAHRLRHCVRPVRGAGLRAGRCGLPRQAFRRSTAGRHRAAPARPGAAERHARALDRPAGREDARADAASAPPAVDQGVGGQQRAADSSRRGDLPAQRREVHAGRLARRRGADPQDDRELADELDGGRFVQIHRSVIVALAQVAQVVRRLNETADVHLRGRSEVLPVSRSYLHLFRQM